MLQSESTATAPDQPATSTGRRAGAVICGVVLFIVLWVVVMNLMMLMAPYRQSVMPDWRGGLPENSSKIIMLWLVASAFAAGGLHMLAKYVAGRIAADYPRRVLTGVIAGLLFLVLVTMVVSAISVSSDGYKFAGLLFSLMFGGAFFGVLWEAWKSRKSAAAAPAAPAIKE